MKKLAISLAAVMISMSLIACTKRDATTRVLTEAGYTDVKITGYRFFGCGQDDGFHTGFEATSPAGKPVEGVVCSGLFKGNTIRLD